MTHFICTGGCGAVSENPGTCQTESCPKHGQPFTICTCEDGKHEDASSKEETPQPNPNQ